MTTTTTPPPATAGRTRAVLTWAAAAVLLGAAGVVTFRQVSAARERARLRQPPPPRPAMVVVTFPPASPDDVVEDGPTPADTATVDALVAGLSADDRATVDLAEVRLEMRPYTDLPLIEAAAARPGLPAAAADSLAAALPRIRTRAAVARRRAHADDGPVAAFYEREAIAEFAAGRHTDPKWDAAAQTFLHLANVRRQLHQAAALRANLAEARRQLRLATDAGCDDPTVLSCAGLLAESAGDPAAVSQGYFARAERANSDGPLFHLLADDGLLRPMAGLSWEARAPLHAQTDHLLIDMADRYRYLAAVPGIAPAVAVRMADATLARASDVSAQYVNIVHRVYDPLEQAVPAGTPGLLTVKARAYVHWAWEARGAGYANTVTDQGWRDFRSRLTVAKQAAEAACAADPGDARAATEMVTLCGALDGDPDGMRTWVRRALAADPDDESAASQALNFLQPKWGGTPEQLVAFGRECLAGGNWRTRQPWVLVQAHDDVAAAVGDEQYWQSPGVWDDVRAVCGGYVERFPNPLNRTQLARYAVLCHRWRAADEQFQQLGATADPSAFGSARELEAARRLAHQMATADPDAD